MTARRKLAWACNGLLLLALADAWGADKLPKYNAIWFSGLGLIVAAGILIVIVGGRLAKHDQ